MNKKSLSARSAAERLDNEIKKLQGAKRLLYECFKKNEINKSVYTSERETVDINITVKTAERDALLATGENQAEAYNSAQEFFQYFLTHEKFSVSDKDMTDKLIVAIYVYSDKSIELKFSFKVNFSLIITSSCDDVIIRLNYFSHFIGVKPAHII